LIKRLTKLSISLLVSCADYGCKFINSILKRGMKGTCIVLYYHHVKNEDKDRFTRQLDYLTRKFKIISANSIGKPLQSGSRSAALTFDDGCRCLLKDAIPELIKRQIPFTLFVPTDHIGGEAKWMTKTNSINSDPLEILSKEELQKLKGSPLVSIGSHCVSHTRLSKLTDEQANMEIVQSKRELESILEDQVTDIAFPHGDYRDHHIEMAKKAGYLRAYSITPELKPMDELKFIIGRTSIEPCDWRIEYLLKINNSYRWMAKITLLKARIKNDYTIV
jgi:peptidoglycan/xylan/chitin deacetylase (PgdA/CDA1 family)